MTTADTIRKLVNNFPGPREGLADFLARELSEMECIRTKLRRIESDRVELRREHEEKLAKLEMEKRALQERCQHQQTTFHGDPSGGRDSHTNCEVCGKIVD